MLSEADRLEWLDNHAAAAPLYAEAERSFAASGDRHDEIHARIGRIRAESQSHSFLEVSAQLAAALEQPVIQGDPQLKLRCLANKGYVDMEINPAAARRDWQQVLLLAQQLKQPEWEARATGELGVLSFLDGDGAKAVQLVGKALFSMQASGDIAGEIRLWCITGIGMSEIGRPQDALGYFEQALSAAAKVPDIGFPFMALEGKAEILANAGKTAEAGRLLEKALDEAKKVDRRANQADIFILLGKMAEKKDPNAAIRYLEEAAGIAQSSQFFRIQAEAMLELSSIYLARNDLNQAEAALTSGVEASRTVGDTHFLPRDLTALADLKLAQGKLAEADALYEQATDVLEAIMVNAANSSVKSSYIGAMSYVYTHHFALAAEQHDAARAFEIVERARARSLADILSSPEVERPGPFAAAKDREISELQIQLMRSQKPTDRKELLDRLFAAEQERFFAAEPSNDGRPLATRPVDLKTFQGSLHPDEAVLEYVLSEPHSYCLAVTRDGIELAALSRTKKEIQAAVAAYSKKVKAKEDATNEERELYAALLEPAAEMRRFKLILVPDGVLHLVSFDALREASGEYVLHSHEVTYAPSSTALYLLRNEGPSQASLPFLGVGDVPYDTLRTPENNQASLVTARLDTAGAGRQRGVETLAGVTLESLPGTKAEVQSAAQMFGSHAVVLLGRDATESEFKSQALSQFRVIHLATHAVSDTKFPERAALVLGRTANSDEDGLLQVREISALRLNADLITLSACDTGVGKLEGEEGIANLERAFLFAGARAVVASLWSADDMFTRALMKQFYLHLSHGMEKGAALRQAKLDVISRYGKHASPYYWAPFVISGDGSTALGAWNK